MSTERESNAPVAAHVLITRWLMVAGLIVGCACMVVWNVMEEFKGPAVWMAFSGGLLFALGFLCNIRWVFSLFSSRQAAYGSGAFIYILVATVLLVAINHISHRYLYMRKDVTSTKKYTLDARSLKILKNLEKDIRIIFFNQGGMAGDQEIQDLLEEYDEASPNVVVDIIDVYLNPTKVGSLSEELNTPIDEETWILVHTEGGAKHLGREDIFQASKSPSMFGGPQESDKFKGEDAITSAVVNVTQEKTATIYFTNGHGERNIDPAKNGREEISLMAPKLLQENFKVRKLQFVGKTPIPEDAAVLAIVGPRNSFQPNEIKVLDTYLKEGGSLLVAIDPGKKIGLEKLLANWGIVVEPMALVLDPKFKFNNEDPRIPRIFNYSEHEITEGFGKRESIFIMACPMVGNPQNIGWAKTNILAMTSAYSWGEMDLAQAYKMKAGFDQGKDAKGPLVVAMTAESAPPPGNPNKPARLVVFGDSDFVSNQYVTGLFQVFAPMNASFFLNAINWLARQEDQIGIRHLDLDIRQVVMNERQQRAAFWITWFGIPGIGMLLGLWVWRMRRS